MLRRNTTQHVQEVLAIADPDFRLLQQSRALLESSRKADNPHLQELEAWTLGRMTKLTGATSWGNIVRHPDVETLMSFAYVGFVEGRGLPLPRAHDLLPAPQILTELEPDFFPVLLKEIKSNADALPSFKDGLKAGEIRLRQIALRLKSMTDSPDPTQPSSVVLLDSGPGTDPSVGVAGAIGLALFAFFLYAVTLAVPGKAKKAVT